MQSQPSTLTDAPKTLAAWQALALDGAAWASALVGLRGKLQALGQPVFLHVIDQAGLDTAISALRQRSDGLSAEELIKEMPLFGVPFVAKDNIDVAGMPTTAACPAFAYQPQTSATAVEKLHRAGAICLAKTNLDQFATGLVGTRSPHGAPASVFDASKISGGSSSGSAVAVGAGWVPFSLGTDTAGSGRIPAMFNHVVGLKPTPGRVSTAGVVPACASLDCVSVFALGVSDAARVLAVIEGADNQDPYSSFQPGPACFKVLKGASACARIGVPGHLPGTVEPWIAQAYSDTLATLRELGHSLVEIDFTALYAVADLLYNGPWVAERYVVIEALLNANPQALDPVVRQVIERATAFDAGATFKAQYKLREWREIAQAIWNQCDLLVVPTAPAHPTHADLADQPIAANARLGLFTNFVNLLGWSALAIPAQKPAGQPFGITLIGPANLDVALIRQALQWEPAFAQSPGVSGLTIEDLDRTPLAGPATQAYMPIVVVGAHLSGLPLNWQLTERSGYKLRDGKTAPVYRLYALPGTVPPKPGMQRVSTGGMSIEVEVWMLPVEQMGSFLGLIPAPLGLGTIELEDGSTAHGFLCEASALAHALDISKSGGWRAYLSTLTPN